MKDLDMKQELYLFLEHCLVVCGGALSLCVSAFIGVLCLSFFLQAVHFGLSRPRRRKEAKHAILVYRMDRQRMLAEYGKEN